jgi:predicted SnoaL-like aldol condensation-catalyzing enzyme
VSRRSLSFTKRCSPTGRQDAQKSEISLLHGLEEWPGDDDYAGIDIFRFDDEGKIAEHWDVLQVIPDMSANE